MNACFPVFLAGLVLGLAAARADSLYVATDASVGITAFASDGRSTVFASGVWDRSAGLAFDNRSVLEAADDESDTVGDFDFTGNDLGALDNPGSSGKGAMSAALRFPSVPEPSTLALLGSAAAALLLFRRRK